MTYTTTTYEYPNCTVRVHRPVLTEDERKLRMDILKSAAANLMMEVVKNEMKQNEEDVLKM